MKRFVYITLLTLVSLNSCKNDDDRQNNCGCSAETIATVQNLEGTLYPIDSQNENTPDANYAIVWNNEEMPGWQTSYYVCNDALINDLGEIPETGKEVIFSGNTKELCEEIITIPEHFHYQIDLTQISLP